jgi:hypothetical protein
MLEDYFMFNRVCDDENIIIVDKEISRELEAINHFKLLISRTIENGHAHSRRGALTYIMTNSTCNGDWRDMCKLRGLPYDYFSKLDLV